MKKVVLLVDSLHYSNQVFHFIEALNKIEPLTLDGVFLSSADFTAVWSYPLYSVAAISENEIKENERQLKLNITSFSRQCEVLQIPFVVHNEADGVVFDTIRKESRFADLLLIDTGVFYKDMGEPPNDYLKQTMEISECPVLLVPPAGYLPKSLALLYDGSESCMFAIKQFAYLFPVLRTLTACCVYVDEKGANLPSEKKMKEELRLWYPNLTFQIARDVHHYHHWFENYPNPLIISGAYGRPALLEFVRKSFLSNIINDRQYFIFLAHK